MALIHGRTYTPGNAPTDGEDYVVAEGFHKEILINQLMGKYYALGRRGRIFNGSTVVAGIAIPLSTTTSPAYGFWNPSGSGVVMVPLMYTLAYVSGACVQTAVQLQILPNTGSAIGAAGAPIVAFTDALVPPVNVLYGLGNKGQVRQCIATSTIVAGGFLCALGYNTWTGADGTVPLNLRNPGYFDFQGILGIPPGNFVYPAGIVAAGSTALFQQSLWYAEVPV